MRDITVTYILPASVGWLLQLRGDGRPAGWLADAGPAGSYHFFGRDYYRVTIDAKFLDFN